MWEKGKSGNPSGRQVEVVAKKLAAKHGPRAIAIIAELMEDSDRKIRLDAAKYMADRAYGKPAQSMEVSGKDGGPLIAVIRDA